MRTPDRREYVHERMATDFADARSSYDTQRRVEVLVDAFLPDEILRGRRVLDVGCGLGDFSARVHARGAIVTACDLGPTLVEMTRRRVGCEAVVADALRLVETFGRDRFDVVISSECIEHTPSPPEAIHQMVSVLRPGGYLSLSTPNLVWKPLVALSTRLRLRPFDGFENFSSWRSLGTALRRSGATVVQERGLHLFPFQLPLHSLSRWCDRHLQMLRAGMINVCVLARRDE